MFSVAQNIGSVLCCKCGIEMPPNAANMCANCLRSEVDITEGLQRHTNVQYCPECQRFLQPPSTWIKAELESNELRALCLKSLTKLNTVRLIDAGFVWTEPHSKRIRIKLRVQKEVLGGAVLEQAYTVEYTVHDHLCEFCVRARANPDQWEAVVQLRQHVPHRRTFFYLEQLILKHNAATNAVRIKQMEQGIDFFFRKENHAVKFVDFVGKVAPIDAVKRDNYQLVSHDTKSNRSNTKCAFSVVISPVCREDLICLPPEVSARLGNLGPLMICHKVSSSIALLDPFALKQCFLDAKQYGRSSLQPLLSSRQLTEYIVLDLEPVSSEVSVGGSRYTLADAHVARVSDFGKNDRCFIVRTHLGNRLSPGDYALGYDLYGANINDMELERSYKSVNIPDVILIKKSYGEKRRGESRSWKLKSLNMEVDDGAKEKMNSEYEHFLRDIEENPDLRFNLSLYDDDGEEVPLEEMLADLDLAHHESHDDMEE